MDLQLAGKVGIVTGASRGIGRAIAQTLSGEGMRRHWSRARATSLKSCLRRSRTKVWFRRQTSVRRKLQLSWSPQRSNDSVDSIYW